LRKEYSENINPFSKRVVQTQYPDVDEILGLWVSQAMSNFFLTGDVTRKKWKYFADLAGIPTNERLGLSDGWLACFKRRNGLKEFKRHGEAGSATPGVVAHERQRVQKLLEERGYDLKDIFNMDETGLFDAYATHSLSFLIDKITRLQTRKVILLQDNFSVHITPENLQNITVVT
jgi:hypothetical protein